jgi:hypothetical protein
MTAIEPSPVAARLNWPAFYEALVRLGPTTLEGIPDGWVVWLQEEGAATDWFWSERILANLEDDWGNSPARAVRSAYAAYVEAVQAGLMEIQMGPQTEGWTVCPSTGVPFLWEICVRKISGQLSDAVAAELLRAACRQCDGL